MDPFTNPDFEPFNLTDIVSLYAIKRFAWYLSGSPLGEAPVPPMQLNAALVADCEILVERMFSAHQNRITLDWDADRYAEHLSKRPNGLNEAEEDRMERRYPVDWIDDPRLLTEPHIVMDKHTRELVWYVPDALSQRRQASLFQSCKRLEGALIGSVGNDESNWRQNPEWFHDADVCSPHPGAVNLSPAWFQQGKNTADDLLEISATLKPGKRRPETKLWLEETSESFALLGAFLAIAHGDLYMSGRAAMRTIISDPRVVKEGADVIDIMKYWSSPFSAIGVISNRASPFHRDNYSRAQFYELLTTIGPYRSARMCLPNLGLELQYDPGTVIGLCGKVVRHGVPATEGDRVCIAQYMRDAVLERLGVPAPGWPLMGNYTVPKENYAC